MKIKLEARNFEFESKHFDGRVKRWVKRKRKEKGGSSVVLSLVSESNGYDKVRKKKSGE